MNRIKRTRHPSRRIPLKAAPLRVGQSGDAVKRLQTALGVKADGVFSASTERAVKSFQEKNGLRPDWRRRRDHLGQAKYFKYQRN